MNNLSRPSPSRWKRPNVWLGKIIPSLIVVFGVSGYRLVLLEVYPYLKSSSPNLAFAYISWVNLFLSLVILCYSLVYFHSNRTKEARSIPIEVQEKRVVFACDKDGEPLRCYQDDCKGSYLSVRTRHCRDCQTCQVGFDHHCSFMDNCVSTSSTFKPFVDFIFYAVLLLGVALVPLLPLQIRAFREVISTTWETEQMRIGWWSKWWSWLGGPFYRYAGAIILGYLQYPTVSVDRAFLVEGHRTKTFVRDGITYAFDESLYPRLATPSLSALALVTFATLIVGIGIAMLISIFLNARRGFSAVQVERSRRYRAQKIKSLARTPSNYDARLRLWIPFTEEGKGQCLGGGIVLVEPDTPLYDFGPIENWRRLMGEHWWEWFMLTTIRLSILRS
ncbi:hypothetical protein JCM5350_002517 [Sporobolomyces pararoseus]